MGSWAEAWGLHGRRREAIVRRQDADFPHKRGELCYNTAQTIQQLCVRRIVGSSETWKVLLKEPRYGECVLSWAHLLS